MASELRVNTLKDASGNNSVATSFVASGSAKAWVRYNQATPGVNDSFNISSVTDVSTGEAQINLSSAFSSVNYSVSGIAGLNDGTDTQYVVAIGIRRGAAPTASNYTTQVQRNLATNSGEYDAHIQMTAAHGDLA
tara:strand:+ start:1789 stop:2193 length:405 start_codon:yes stop_codon:yes gene_type:complete